MKVASILGSIFGVIAMLSFPGAFLSIFFARDFVYILVGLFFITVPLSLYFHMLAGEVEPTMFFG
jgi:hypothetical protein